jgi:hypothetical protein
VRERDEREREREREEKRGEREEMREIHESWRRDLEEPDGGKELENAMLGTDTR